MKIKNKAIALILTAAMIFSPLTVFAEDAENGLPEEPAFIAPGTPFTPGNVNVIHGVAYTNHADGVPGFTEEPAAVLEIAPGANARLLAGVPRYSYVQGYGTVGGMAASYTEQGYDVIAAINGGFFGLLNPGGEQIINQGVLIHNGELLRHWDPGANNEYIAQEHYIIGTKKNGDIFHGHNPLHIMEISVNGGEARPLNSLNNIRSAGNPWWNDLNLITGGFDEAVRSSSGRLAGKDVRLEVISGVMSFGEDLVLRVIREAAHAEEYTPLGREYALLTASHVRDTAFLDSLRDGDTVTVSNSFVNRRGCDIDWTQVDQAIPAHFALIKNGERQPLPRQPGAIVPAYPGITPNPDTVNPLPFLPSQNTKRPRTAVGLRADGTMVWVVVSGGAWNFDGGGSSAMIIGETLVTYSSGAGSAFQRPVANGLILAVNLPKPEPEQEQQEEEPVP
jgi:hypothetical protein